MAIAVVALVFFTILGLLAILYTVHFRRRALSMGSQRLQAALSRTVSGDEEATEVELSLGISQLEARLNRVLYSLLGVLVVILVACLVLVAQSRLPELTLALSGLCLFLTSLAICTTMIRDILKRAARLPEKAGPPA
ncbi:MAG: hypothetical protein AB1384_08895 [Actinomycetota bacterium]